MFLNIVLDEAVEEKDGGEKVRLGMVVRSPGIWLVSHRHEVTDTIDRLFEETPLSCSRHWNVSAATIDSIGD